MSGNSGHVVVVTFDVGDAHREAFLEAVVGNARLSLAREPGCRVFDVCATLRGEILLYEVYDDEAAFAHHLATDHFRAFDATVAPWVVGKRIATYARLSEGA